MIAFLIDLLLTGTVAGMIVRFSDFALPHKDWLFVLGFFWYKAMAEAAFGTTLGKRVLGLRVIQASGRQVDPLAAVFRNVLMVPEMFVAFLPSLLMVGFRRRHQRLGDVVAKTLVVDRGEDVVWLESAVDPASISVNRRLVAEPEGVVASHRWLIAGSGTLLATATIGMTIAEIRLLTSWIFTENHERVTPSIFPHSIPATIVMYLALALAIVVVPFVAGGLIRSWT